MDITNIFLPPKCATSVLDSRLKCTIEKGAGWYKGKRRGAYVKYAVQRCLPFYLDMPPKQANKRRKVATTPEEATASIELEEGWLGKFLELAPEELAKVLANIANQGRVKTAAFKKARTSLPSFSAVKWIDFAENFGLHNRLENNQFEQVTTPTYWLPPSIHEIMFEAAWHTQDVYQEWHVQRREAARVRIMDPVCLQSHLLCFSDFKICQYLVHIMGLFQGRVIDKPGTEYASGGEVEHKVCLSLHQDVLIRLSYPDLHDWWNTFFNCQVQI